MSNNTAADEIGTPSNGNQAPNSAALTPLIDGGYELIPLRHRDKRPVQKDWTTRPPNSRQQIRHMDEGGNVGVRLRSTDLVIDVDPRNFKKRWGETDPFSEFVLRLGLDPDAYPMVETGGGGFHFYLKKPADIPIVDGLPDDYPGVEFKTVGRQVVAPGSVHPSGNLYKWDAINDNVADAPDAPDSLIDFIRRPTATSATGGGEIDSEQLATMLATLDPEDFSNHDKWLTLMMACHHATGGDGKSEFIEWSTRDPVYSDHDEIIGKRWDSLRADNDGSARVTYGTLRKIINEKGDSTSIPAEALDKPPLKNNQPMEIAKVMLNGKSFWRSNSEWFRYDEKLNYYKAVTEESFNSYCWNWIDGRPYIDRKKDGEEIKHLVSAKTLIANVSDAANAQRQGPETAPGWIDEKPGDKPPTEILVCSNGLLHLPTRELLPPSERFFSVNGSPVAFDAAAPKPKRWLKFLQELFPDEPDCIDTLQEVTGYFLSQDTSLQKIIQLIGPPRAGKGVYTRVLLDLVGKGNVTSPTAKSLSGEFGRQPLIGKQLATISDSRVGRGVNTTALTDTLLTISGEDDVSIPRKYLHNWQGKLNTRFLIVSNEMLQLRDTSDALGNRMIVIKTRQSFLGREDEGLTAELKGELPGILNWALNGLERLKARRHFVQPQSCMAEVMHMHLLTSPVKFFLDTEVIKGSELKVKKDRLWQAFEEWCLERELNYSGGKEHFIKDLNSAGGRYRQARLSEDGKRIPYLLGLDLKADFQEMINLSAIEDFKDVED